MSCIFLKTTKTNGFHVKSWVSGEIHNFLPLGAQGEKTAVITSYFHSLEGCTRGGKLEFRENHIISDFAEIREFPRKIRNLTEVWKFL